MALTLWRGEHLIGELRPSVVAPEESSHRLSKPSPFAAFLVRAPDAPWCDGVWQAVVPIPGFGVQQQPVEPDIVSQRYLDAKKKRPASSGALSPISPEEAAGVPPEKQLTVRDAAGNVYLPRQIWLRESRFEPEHYADWVREAPAEALVGGVLWTVFIDFADEAAPSGIQ